MNFQGGPLSYESVVTQTPANNTTVYVGNLVQYATQADLIPLFQSIGYLSEIRMQADRGFAFVKLDTHEHAAMAIVQLQGQMVHGRPIKCSWGKDRADGGAAIGSGGMSPTPAAAPYANMVRRLHATPGPCLLPLTADRAAVSTADVRHAHAQHLRPVRFRCLRRVPQPARRRWHARGCRSRHAQPRRADGCYGHGRRTDARGRQRPGCTGPVGGCRS